MYKGAWMPQKCGSTAEYGHIVNPKYFTLCWGGDSSWVSLKPCETLMSFTMSCNIQVKTTTALHIIRNVFKLGKRGTGRFEGEVP